MKKFTIALALAVVLVLTGVFFYVYMTAIGWKNDVANDLKDIDYVGILKVDPVEFMALIPQFSLCRISFIAIVREKDGSAKRFYGSWTLIPYRKICWSMN